MADKFKEEMKKSLLALKQDILQNLASRDDSFNSLLTDEVPKDDVDITSDDIDRSMLEKMSIQDVNKLHMIDAALARIQANRYGLCLQCGKKISEGRLRALPYAILCIECKSADERMNR
ncbi:MAG: TraR/DksA family transcriptional regulator [Spirochaetia bacterium]|nr:TraR/DksA family transcriptional regulator [Spirochaetia bacterium]